MSHWAELDENNKVLRVLVGDNNDPNGDEGYQWLIDNLGGTWIQTSYNTHANQHPEGRPLHKNYAGIGDTYDADRNAFIAPKPYNSWVLDENTCVWNAPTPLPIEEGKVFTWNEPTLEWVELNLVTE
jgi:hypothetical protein